MDYDLLDPYQILPLLKKTVSQERRTKSPSKKSELMRHRKRLERKMLLEAEFYLLANDIVEYASNVIKAPWLDGEKFLLGMSAADGGPEYLCKYALNVVKGRWPAAEKMIAEEVSCWEDYLSFLLKKDKNALVAACKSMDVFALWYAEQVAEGEWKPGERAILKGKDWVSYYYARAMGRRWEPGEKKILAGKDPGTCLDYAEEVIKGRWPEAEKLILKDAHSCLKYAEEVIKGRWPEAEKVILKNAILEDDDLCFAYALNVVRGRWEEYERAIIDDPYCCYQYARGIIKGRLPEHMHTAMVMHSFSEPDNKWVKKYLGAKKYNKAV
jgi:hypothetical protein